ncbi:DUF4391 domain-containing protein [Hallella sp.]|uniref:DUF4391 domain-containing protein n=1 Tax=Hallella sp. TaxID=2980186 RepID=UPI003079DBDE
MIVFPKSTLVGKPVPKTAFYRNLEVNSKMKQRFVDSVESITWTAKLAPSTLSVADGKTVHEITVFRMVLKKEEVPSDVLTLIDKQMPRHTLFLLQHDDAFCLLVNYKEWHDAANTRFDIVKTFQTGWTSADKLSLSLDGQDMDAVYSAIVKQVAGADITSEAKDIHTAVAQTKEQEALRQKIAVLEAKIAKERQPKKKFELHQQLVKLKENNE